MLKLFTSIMLKSVAKDTITMAVKSSQNGDVIKEKLGVSTIDEFMKMNIYDEKKG